MSSCAVLPKLFAQQGIRVRKGATFSRQPPRAASAAGRFEGMMLGLAIGDSLGNTSEGFTPEQRRAHYGAIRDYLPHPRFRDRRGYPSDDTQLAAWTLEQIITDGHFRPENVARRFTQSRIYGIGQTVAGFLKNQAAGKPWEQCGPPSAGNGALMRIAPIVLPHIARPSPALWADAALCAMITHNDSMAIASAVAFVRVLVELMAMESAPRPEWWLDTFVETLRDLECNDTYEPRTKDIAFRGPLWQFLAQELPPALGAGAPAVDACNRWYSGAYLLETVPSVVYILMRHAADPEEAIVRAVNDTVDNDTVGAIVGAAVGALHGRAALPQRWVEGLSGRTTDCDEGRLFHLLAAAARLWPDSV